MDMTHIADLSAEIDLKSTYISWLDRLKRSATGQWPQLVRQKRTGQEAVEVSSDNALSREKRNENDQELSREKRIVEETENPEKVLSRQKRNDGEEELSRQKRVSVYKEVHEEEGKRQGRELLREKRSEGDTHENEERELSRKKRDDTLEEELSRITEPRGASSARRLQDNNEENALSRQKRADQRELPQQKSFDPTQSDPDMLEIQLLDSVLASDRLGGQGGEKSSLSSPKRDSESLRGYEFPTQMSQSPRSSSSEPELLRHKYSEPLGSASGHESLRHMEQLSPAESISGEISGKKGQIQLLSRQKRDMFEPRQSEFTSSEYKSATEGETILSRQKRDLSLTMRAEPENSSGGLSRQKRKDSRGRSAKDSAIRGQAQLLKREAELLERMKHEPEHKSLNELLLLRRIKNIRAEYKRRKKDNQLDLTPDNEDSWDQELRIRSELAEKAIEYGIQQRKERMRNPDPNRPLSVLQRIKQDAEEIIRRRAEEEMQRKQASRENASTRRETKEEEEEERVEEEEEEKEEEEEVEEVETEGKESKKERRKTEKAIRQLLNLGVGKKDKALKKFNIASSDRSVTHADPTQADATQTNATQANATQADAAPANATQAREAVPDYDESILRFGAPSLKGKAARIDRKKMKKHNKAAVRELNRRNRDGYFQSIGLPALRVSKR